MGVCYCLQTCNLVVNMVVTGLVIGQSLMAISTTGILLYAKVCPFYNIVGMHPIYKVLLYFVTKDYIVRATAWSRN